MRTLILALCIVGFCAASAGCSSPRSTIFSGAYFKRVAMKVLDDFHQFRVDADRILLDLDDRPLEDF